MVIDLLTVLQSSLFHRIIFYICIRCDFGKKSSQLACYDWLLVDFFLSLCLKLRSYLTPNFGISFKNVMQNGIFKQFSSIRYKSCGKYGKFEFWLNKKKTHEKCQCDSLLAKRLTSFIFTSAAASVITASIQFRAMWIILFGYLMRCRLYQHWFRPLAWRCLIEHSSNMRRCF